MEKNPKLKKIIGIVEADKTYICYKSKGKRKNGSINKIPVVSLIGHIIVNHSEKEYVNGIAYANTVEGYFFLWKLEIIGACNI